ncbi:MAG: aminotransferase class V-fold PLP-dependent enzyme [Candidatus Nanopelagicales bacterium]|nr:aminotransferase class V-fold PLP-dependent enzyme [Candidatus Nanopelagicales bacterium]MDZ4249768.1 aminotransferase class V-fold PLP-dependent enzyme [Candidatus Nanopelagicales bacterium]
MPDVATQDGENRRYLDAASGLPPSPATRTALANASATAWADPSRRYPQADVARRLLAHARTAVADVLACRPTEIAFTSSADAALAAGLQGCLASRRSGSQRRGVVVSAVEDLGLLRRVDRIEAQGIPVTVVPCDRAGLIDPDRFITAVDASDAAAACLQMANGEVGTLQPIGPVSQALEARRVPLISDARHVVGRSEISSGWHVLAAEARYWGGPPGVGILAVRSGVGFQPMDNGPLGVEGVAPPVPAVAAAALALEQAAATVSETARTCGELTQRLRERLVASIPNCEALGSPDQRLGHILMVTFLYVAAEQLVDELAGMGWAVSSGASCVSDTRRPHHVLAAMGVSSHGSLRVSLQPAAKSADVDEFARDLTIAVTRIREQTGVSDL